MSSELRQEIDRLQSPIAILTKKLNNNAFILWEMLRGRAWNKFQWGRIQEIEGKLGSAQIIDVTKMQNNGKVIFGATVTLTNVETDEEVTYRIVGDDEANIKEGLISVNSPIARGLVGKEVDDSVTITTPGGKVEFDIIDVEYV